jgi:hypothetical protein
VRVDDIGSKLPRHASRIAGETQVPSSTTGAPLDDCSRELEPTARELALEVGNEDSEVGIVRPRIHLGNEKDSQ